MENKIEAYSQKQKIDSGYVSIWTINLEEAKKYISFYETKLNSEELQKAKKFRFEKDVNSFVITRAVLRILLGQYLGLEPHHIKFAYNSYGKPALECRKSLHFNVSHSGKFSLISFFKDAEIGIDIEESKPNFDVLDLAQNFFSKLEIEDLRKISEKEKHRAFYRCWTRKEAFIKAQGSGLSFPLNKFRVSLNNDYEAKLLNTYWDEKIKKQWSLKSFVPSTGYLAAVAVNSNVKNYVFYDWNRLNKLNTI